MYGTLTIEMASAELCANRLVKCSLLDHENLNFPGADIYRCKIFSTPGNRSLEHKGENVYRHPECLKHVDTGQ